MTGNEQRRAGGGYRSTMGAITALLATLAVVGACTWMPDAVNPVEWYKGAKGWVSGDKKADAAGDANAKPVPGADRAFPKLSSVPARPTEEERRQAIAERERTARVLAADRDEARYTDQVIRGSGQAAAAPPPRQRPVAPQTARTAPTVRQPPSAPPRVIPPARPSRPAPRIVSPRIASPAVAPPPAAPPPPARIARPARQATPPPVRTTRQVARSAPVLQSAARSAPVLQSAARPGLPRLILPRQSQPRQSPARQSQARRFSTLSFGAPPADIAARLATGGARPALSRRAGFRIASLVRPGRSLVSGGAGGTLATTVYFANGSARLGPKGRREVRRVYRAYRAGGGTLRVVGHASSRTRDLDTVRHQMANFNVSLDRANAVARELIRLGARPETVLVDAASDSQPIYLEVMPSGEAGNRRTEIHLER